MSLNRAFIENYIDHWEEPAYVARILREASLPEITDTIGAILKEQDFETCQNALTFLQDVSLMRSLTSDEFRGVLQEHLSESAVVEPLEACLYCDQRTLRSQAIYSIGKIQFRGFGERLLAAFPNYLERDPLNIGRLIQELGMFGVDHPALIKLCAEHEHFLFRWAALGSLEKLGPGRFPYPGFRIQRTLTHDENIVVRTLARHMRRHYIRELFLDWIPGRKRRFFDHPWSFANLELRYHNKLCREEKRNYSLAEMETFALEFIGST